jgi:xanthine dehydrogenase small subunit
MRDFLIIHVNGKRHEIRGGRAFQSLSDFLRYDLGLGGTKVVCAEGDCGSCSVLLGRREEASFKYSAITSCIAFLYQLDGAHIVTVEGLAPRSELNPVQEAMVRCQGTQCGFCTPGFVVAMCAMFESEARVDADALRYGLTGNLCRCTGYESIVRAGLEVDAKSLRKLEEIYPSAAMQIEEDDVLIDAGGKKFYRPTTIDQAVRFKAENPTCVPIAGGTDLGVQINKGIRNPDCVLCLGGIRALREIVLSDGVIEIGALATLTDLERKTREIVPEFAKMLWRHGSPLIRNAGTLAGNIANGSPIGDTMPALFVLNAEVELTGRGGARRVNMNDFYTGYRKTVMQPDELITRVFMPLPKADEHFRLYKVSKRHDLDISSFTAAFWMKRENGVIGEIRIAYGGVGPVIMRMRKTEEQLRGKPLNEAEIESAAEIARGEITPISDVRGETEFRFQLAENILRKFFADVSGEQTYQRITRGAESWA